MIGDGTKRYLQCKHCKKRYKKSGYWFFRHFEKHHPGEKIACKVVYR